MKYLILILSLSIFSVQAYDDTYDCSANRSVSSEIMALKKRIRELEAVVARLQAVPPASRSAIECSGRFFSAGYLSVRGKSETEARINLSNACKATYKDKYGIEKRTDLHCETHVDDWEARDNRVSCVKVEE